MLKEFANANRSNPTEAESILWNYVRADGMGYRFKRQHIIDCYIADFVCLDKALVIEVDGGYHQLPTQVTSDKERSERLNELGFRVLRFTNEEIMCDIENVIEQIKNALI